MPRTMGVQTDCMRLVYVDESGGHDLSSPDPNYPVFVLAAAVFDADLYAREFVPALTRLKIRHLGHDGHVLHEAEIRKRVGIFGFARNETRQRQFMDRLAELVDGFATSILAQVLLPDRDRTNRADLKSAHHLVAALAAVSTEPCMILLERRGRTEDDAMRWQLEHSFGQFGLAAEIDFCPKSHAVPGLELADLVARPIGLHVLRPHQENRAFALLRGRALIEVRK